MWYDFIDPYWWGIMWRRFILFYTCMQAALGQQCLGFAQRKHVNSRNHKILHMYNVCIHITYIHPHTCVCVYYFVCPFYSPQSVKRSERLVHKLKRCWASHSAAFCNCILPHCWKVIASVVHGHMVSLCLTTPVEHSPGNVVPNSLTWSGPWRVSLPHHVSPAASPVHAVGCSVGP